MSIHRGFRYKLSPTVEQAARFRQFAGVVRLVYKLALEQRRDWWRPFERATGASRRFYVSTACQLRATYRFAWLGKPCGAGRSERIRTSGFYVPIARFKAKYRKYPDRVPAIVAPASGLFTPATSRPVRR